MKTLTEMTVAEVAELLRDMTDGWIEEEMEDGGQVQDHLADQFGRDEIKANIGKISDAWEAIQ